MDGMPDIQLGEETFETIMSSEERNQLAAQLTQWVRRRSPSNVAHQLGISMARARGLRAGRLDDCSRDVLIALAIRARLKV